MNQTALIIQNPKLRTAEQLLIAGRYNQVNYVVSEAIRKKKFSVDEQLVGEFEIVIISVDENVDSHDVVSKARELGLRRPVYAEALLLGEQHPDEQRKGPIVFLHDPQYSWSGHSFNLVLTANKNRRAITFVSASDWWHSGYRFAFVRQTRDTQSS
jgi:hypothetical protein